MAPFYAYYSESAFTLSLRVRRLNPPGILWYNNKNVRREIRKQQRIFIMCKGGRQHAGAIEGGCLESESAASKG